MLPVHKGMSFSHGSKPPRRLLAAFVAFLGIKTVVFCPSTSPRNKSPQHLRRAADEDLWEPEAPRSHWYECYFLPYYLSVTANSFCLRQHNMGFSVCLQISTSGFPPFRGSALRWESVERGSGLVVLQTAGGLCGLGTARRGHRLRNRSAHGTDATGWGKVKFWKFKNLFFLGCDLLYDCMLIWVDSNCLGFRWFDTMLWWKLESCQEREVDQ